MTYLVALWCERCGRTQVAETPPEGVIYQCICPPNWDKDPYRPTPNYMRPVAVGWKP